MRIFKSLFLFVIVSVTALAQNVTLDSWDFLADPSGTLNVENLRSATAWRKARAGLSWQAQFDDMRDYAGVAWYRTSVDIPQFEHPERVLLRFGAVDYSATVYVNGKDVGTHEGGYTPFAYDITDLVRPGANAIAVRVSDPSSNKEPGKSLYRSIPHGKQSWYVQTSGLWQPVTLELRPASYIDSIRVTPQNDGRVQIDFDLKGARPGSGSLFVVIRDPQGGIVAQHALPLAQQSAYQIVATVPAPELWNTDHPALYTVEAHLGAYPDDVVTTRFGFRHFEARNGKLFLNGRPFYMIGALDQDFYPDTIYSPPSHAYVRREMELAKKLGLNTLRCHIKVCEPEYLDAADEAGILVWYEIPNWDNFDAESDKRGEDTFDAMIARDWNHPSIVIQSIINESWGIDLKKSDQRAWLRQMTERAQKVVAPIGRLIVDNSACCENFHVRSDLEDFHQYYSIPDHAAKWDAWVADFASGPKWSFSPHGDAQRTGSEPLIVSEFGNWGLPQLPENLPWWFPRSNAEITRPAGVYDRFREYKFGRIFQDYDALARATQWHEFLSLKHEIEEMRRYGSIQGYVITEFTDINWESNGLLTMWREPKVYAAELSRIQQPDVVLARLAQHNLTSGYTATAELFLSHYSTRPLKGAILFWHTDAGQFGRVTLADDSAPASVLSLGAISIPAATTGSGLRVEHLYLEIRDAAGALIAENAYPLNVFQVQPRQNATVSIYDPSGALPHLREQFASRGYRITDSAPVMLATRWDDRVDEYLQLGGHVIVLVDAPDALPSGLAVQMKQRKDDYDGDWVSNFAWVDPHSPVFRDITAGPILGWEASAVTPRFVLRATKPENYDDVLSGMFYGWINLNSPLLVQARVGSGAALVTTFRFDHYGSDPYATALLDALVGYASSPEFRPRMEWTR